MSIYTLDKDKFFYLTNNDETTESIIKLKLLYFDNEPIKLGFKIENNGYIIVEINDENDTIINEYSYNNFIPIDIIESNDYELKWDNQRNIFNGNFIVNIKFKNAKLFYINRT